VVRAASIALNACIYKPFNAFSGCFYGWHESRSIGGVATHLKGPTVKRLVLGIAISANLCFVKPTFAEAPTAIVLGDSKQQVLAKLRDAPVRTEARMLLGISQETLAFRTGLTTTTVVLVFDKVVAVETRETSLPELIFNH